MSFESGQHGPDGPDAAGPDATWPESSRAARRRRGAKRRTGSHRVEPAEPARAEPDGAEPVRAEPVRAEPVRAEPEPIAPEPPRESVVPPGHDGVDGVEPPARGGRRAAGRHSAGGHGRAGRDLRAATLVGVSLLLLIAASLFLWMPAFVGIVIVAVVLAVSELSQALNTRGVTVPVVPVLIGAVLMCIGAYVGGVGPLVATFGLTVVAVGVWRLGDPATGYLRDVTAGIFTTVYVPLLGGFVLLLAASADGTWAVIALLAVVVASDTGGYAAGVLFGRHPMARTVSPKKSWEGFAGSLLFGSAVGVGVMILGFGADWWTGLILGVVGVAAATVGDLGESLLKRDLGIKDMSDLLPGHGGLMDRVDSILPTAPLVWLVLTFTVGL